MTNNLYIPLENRSVFTVSGADAENFLQGLITNDIKKASEHKAIYALMLTPQGKFLYDFFILKINGKFFVDCATEKLAAIIKKFSMYKLRSDVVIEDVSNKYEIVALIGDGVFDAVEHKNAGDVKQFCKGAAYIDPRSDKIYARSFIEKENDYQSFKAYNFEKGTSEQHEEVRINSCIPSGDYDMQSEKSFPLDFAIDKLNGIDYQKGCYVGQEVTARVHHRGKVRKKLYLIEGKSSLPAHGNDVLAGSSKAGIILSSCDNIGLALLQTETVEKENNMYKVNDTEVMIRNN